MSQNNKQSSSSFYRGLVIGVVIAITGMTVFNQITNSVNIRPVASESISNLKQQIQEAWFTNASASANAAEMETPIKTNLPPVIVRKPMNEEKSIIQPSASDRAGDPVVEPKPLSLLPKPKPVWTPPVVSGKTTSDAGTDRLTEAVAAVSKPSGSYNPPSRAECQSKYGNRRYYHENEQRLPPMLYTFPGSGNTWCRLLIEYSSGIYSGAVYNDASLLEPLPGEFKCNHLVSVVKVHPHTHTFEDLRTGMFHSDNDKCKKGNVKAFKRAILLIRNPFDSIWSEFQRRVTQSHVTGIKRVGFDWHRWQANAASLSHMYHQMWSMHHAGIEKHFSKDNYLYIKYEDLKNKKGVNVATMRKVTDFLGMPATDEKLSCAFVLAENPDAHRTIDKHTMMTKEDAYTRELTCRMWALFGEYAEKHGYKPYNNYDCSQMNSTSSAPFPKIRNVNVGSQGEYDFKWVKPGQKLIDFGGYNKTAYLPLPGEGQGQRGPGGMRKRKPRPNGGATGMGQGQGGGGVGRRNKAGGGGGLHGGNGAAAGARVKNAPVAAAAEGVGQVGLNQPAWK